MAERTRPRRARLRAAKTKAFCPHNARRASEGEYDVIVGSAFKAMGWPMPAKETLVLADTFDSTRQDDTGDYPEYFFNKVRGRRRQWRHDYLDADRRIAIEVEGVSPRGSHNRHQSFVGYSADCQKHNAVNLLGLTLLRYTPAQLREGQLLADLRLFRSRGLA